MTLVIVTCDRRDQRYLRNLSGQVDASGWEGPRCIVSDGPLRQSIAGWGAAASAEYLGQMPTYWRALAIGLDTARGAARNRITILEDDVELCHNALFRMERVSFPPDLDFVTWYDGHAVPAGTGAGIHRVPARRFVCLQGVTWTTATAERLLQSPAAGSWGEPHRADLLISQILTGRTYGVHTPNLVQHCGADSICSPGHGLIGLRTAANYPGPDFDALSLPDW